MILNEDGDLITPEMKRITNLVQEIAKNPEPEVSEEKELITPEMQRISYMIQDLTKKFEEDTVQEDFQDRQFSLGDLKNEIDQIVDKLEITFITSNPMKLSEFNYHMEQETKDMVDPHYEIKTKKIELDEFQGLPNYIAEHKAKLAAQKHDGPVLIEDVSLCFNAMNGLPGPYVKDFQTHVGPRGLWKMMEPYEDKTAYALCSFALCLGPWHEPITFVGRMDGTIVQPLCEQGDGTFGEIFIPKGFDRTLNELTRSEKMSISHRGDALRKVHAYLKNKENVEVLH